MLDLQKTKQRLEYLASIFKAYVEISHNKDKAKWTKSDKRRLAEWESELTAIMEPEERSSLVVDITTLMRFFRVSKQTVTNWCKDRNCPKIRHGLYDLQAVFEWWVKEYGGVEDSEDAKRIKTEILKLDRDTKAVKLAQLQETLISRDEIAQAWAARVGEVTSGLMTLADRLPPLLVGKDRGAMREVVDAEIRQLRESYARSGKYCELVS